MSLRQEIENFHPQNEQEQADKQALLWWLDSGVDIFTRQCTAAHLTASAWVVSPDRKKVLMIYHNIYRSWAWLGGHADGMTDLRAVAEKEVAEECGLTHLNSLCPGIFSHMVAAGCRICADHRLSAFLCFIALHHMISSV